jgi:hypothetical protein
MPYTPNTPAPNTVANQTRKPINDNFVALAPWGFGYGQFLLQAAAPTFAAGVDGMYVLNNNALTSTTKNELFIRKQSNDAPTDIPFTASKMSDNTMINCVNGWAYLPNGMLMKWGGGEAPSAIIFAVDVNAKSGGPAFNRVFQTTLSSQYGSTPTNTPPIAILAASGTTVAGNFTMFMANFDPVPARSFYNYIILGV